ncbi:hypothetical protein CsatB_009399 [Cannabis sativa]
MGARTAKEAWDTLQEEFQGIVKVRTVRLQKLRRDFENLKIKDNETAKYYYSRIKEIANQMGAYGEIISDKNIVQKILISCTEKYDSIVSVIKETKDLETISLTEIMDSLEAYESRRERHKESEAENTFQSKLNSRSQKPKAYGKKTQEKQKENNEKYPPCAICKRKSHLEKDCWFKGKPQCQNCKKFGHTKKTCRLKKAHQANFFEEKNDENSRLKSKSVMVTSWKQSAKAPLPLTLKEVKMKENRCFPIQWRYASNVAMQAQIDESWLWYRRFGHFNFHGLKILTQKNMMRDLPKIKEINTVCEGCMLEKQHRQPFPSGKTWRVKKPLELVHTDVCGAMRTPSNDQNKDGAPTHYWIRTKQNGVSERKNRTVMEAARAMLLEKGLLKRFRAKAVSTVVYFLNRCPTKAVQNKTPIKAWSRRKPSLKHLKVFDCICYSHIPKEKRDKLDEKTAKGIFLGYNTQSKGYRVYSLETNNLIISQDVKFDEDATYN